MASGAFEAMRWLAWTLAYALAIDRLLAVISLPCLRRWTDPMGEALAQAMFVLPAGLAFAIGVRFAALWWMAGPPVGLILPCFALVAAARRRVVRVRIAGDNADVGVEGMATIFGLVVIVRRLVGAASAFAGVAAVRWQGGMANPPRLALPDGPRHPRRRQLDQP